MRCYIHYSINLINYSLNDLVLKYVFIMVVYEPMIELYYKEGYFLVEKYMNKFYRYKSNKTFIL